MIIFEARTADGQPQNFEEFAAYSNVFGAKAAGLRSIPLKWCPPYCVVSKHLHDIRLSGGAAPSQLNQAIDSWLRSYRTSSSDGFIVRSSGVAENIEDRGILKSLVIGSLSTSIDVLAAAEEIFAHADDRGHGEKIALIVQVYMNADGAGHLANEVRVSPTRNQWQYELEKPVWVAPKGINSKFAPRPDPTIPLSASSVVPHATLRSVGKWLTETCGPRVHAEWAVAHKHLWILQLDFEWMQLDHGVNPRDDIESSTRRQPDLLRQMHLHLMQSDRIRVGKNSRILKISILTNRLWHRGYTLAQAAI